MTERYTVSGACVACERDRYEIQGRAYRKTAPQSVYVLAAGTAVKIGVSAGIRARLQVVQTHCPHPVEVKFCSDPIPHVQAKQVESRVCEQFSHKCLHGSWFSANADEVIAAIQAELTDPFA